MKVKKLIGIEPEQNEFIQEHSINLSKLIQKTIDALMRRENGIS